MRRRREYDQEHVAPQRGHALPGGNILGLRPFTDRLCAIIWPKNFKLHDLDTYDGKANPEQWVILYEITVRVAGGDEDVMANYLPVVINQSANQWLLSLWEGSINTWAELRKAFVDNYMATCQQPSNKYDLEKVKDYPNEPMRDYICRFSETWISIPNINNDEAIFMFIRGLYYHDALRTKLLRKRPESVQDLLMVAKK
jgi:hypothetical protein